MTLKEARSVPVRFGSDWSLKAKRTIELGAELANMRDIFEREFDLDLSNAPSFQHWDAEQLEKEIKRIAGHISSKRLADQRK